VRQLRAAPLLRLLAERNTTEVGELRDWDAVVPRVFLHRRYVRGHAFSETGVFVKRLTHDPVPRAPNVPREEAQLQVPVHKRPDRVFGEHSERGRGNIHFVDAATVFVAILGGLVVAPSAFAAGVGAEELCGGFERAGDERHCAPMTGRFP
jgi:hypothetical protein